MLDETKVILPTDNGRVQQSAPKPRKTSRKKKTRKSSPTGKRGRAASKPFPGTTFESVLPLAKVIFDYAGASREMRRLTVFDKLGKGPESGPSRMLIINSGRYGLTVGGVKAEVLKLTDHAVWILDPSTPPARSAQAKFDLAIKNVAPFNALYEKFKSGKLPAPEVMKDALDEFKLDEVGRQECVDIFIGNAKYVGLLRVLSGAERLLSIEHVLDELGAFRPPAESVVAGETIVPTEGQVTEDYDSVCFFVAPIGKDGEVERKHSDMVLSSLVERALEPLKLKVIRADKITAPGMISKQIIEYLLRSKLVIVDLSFHNPNVFYELALRHVTRKTNRSCHPKNRPDSF